MADYLEPPPESNDHAIVVIVDKVIRQTDPHFRNLLQKVRDGTMDDDAVDFLLGRHYSALSIEEREEFDKAALFLMPTWKRTKPITMKYLRQVGNPIAVIQADESALKYQMHSPDFSIPSSSVLMEGTRAQLQTNFVVEQELYNGAVGNVIKIVYADKQGPNAANKPLPAYVVVDFPFSRIPAAGAWDKNNPTWVPIPPMEFRCKLDCCRVTTVPLRIHKATSIHKGQGISCGKGKPNELVVVGLGGERGLPGLDLVGLSRATEISAMAIYNDLPITREQLFKIGKGKGYEKKREFESKLRGVQAKTVPPMMELIKSQDTAAEKSFSGGCQQLIQWFRCEQGDTLPLPAKQLDTIALETDTKIFLDSLTETPSGQESNKSNDAQIDKSNDTQINESKPRPIRSAVPVAVVACQQPPRPPPGTEFAKHAEQ